MNIENFISYIDQKPLASGEWWFADGEEVPEIIRQMTADDVGTLVRDKGHLKAAARVRQALDFVDSLFERRSHALEIMVACAISRVNLVLLGPPGTGKSLMVRSFAETMGVRPDSEPIGHESGFVDEARRAGSDWVPPRRRLFEYLLTRYTTPEELFGGTDIDLMLKAGIHCRRSQGMLPQAEVAFLDEIFKANNAILNALLSLTNERLFYNMGQAFRVDLAFVVGASNETPDQEELGALYDRFPVRVPCRRVDASLLGNVIRKSHNFATQGIPSRIACLNDIRLLSRVVQEGVYGGREDAFPDGNFEKKFLDLLYSLRDDYSISDRTPAQLLRLCRALGLLEPGGPAANLSARHLRCFGYVAQKMEAFHDLQRMVKARIQLEEPGALNLYDDV